jgi:hypothetical protein
MICGLIEQLREAFNDDIIKHSSGDLAYLKDVLLDGDLLENIQIVLREQLGAVDLDDRLNFES